VLDALVWLERETTQLDTALLLLAGHGATTDDGESFSLPAEADEDRPEVAGVSGADLVRRLPGRVPVFLDACYAGALYAQRTRGPPGSPRRSPSCWPRTRGSRSTRRPGRPRDAPDRMRVAPGAAARGFFGLATNRGSLMIS
jgi:hypothetical protein